MRLIKSFFLIINYKTFILAVLSLGATYLCFHFKIQANFPLTLVGIAIVFPVVFSIDSAYKRRERALGYLAEFKVFSLSLFHASRDWIEDEGKLSGQVKEELLVIYTKLQTIFIDYKPHKGAFEDEIYPLFSELSLTMKGLRRFGLAGGELSRANQYLAKISESIENLRIILDYRTPVTLRAYSRIFIYTFPILYAPFFVFISKDYTPGFEYMLPIVFSFILVSLDNIQDHLENPFDQVGEDDVKFEASEFERMLN